MPLRPWTVNRETLLGRLRREAGDASLIAFEASPGYGKSTAMRQWMDSRRALGWRTAWLSLDPADDEPSRFAALLAGAFSDLAEKPLAPGTGDMLELDTIVGEFLAHDFASAPAAILIDDFQAISCDGIHAAVGRLAIEAPDGLQVVIGSRVSLPLSMSKARLLGTAVTLREADLAFDRVETRSILSGICNRNVTDEDAERLRARSGGWAALLQMAGLALRSSGDPRRVIDEFSGLDVEVSHYLCEVALDLQSAPVRELLLLSSPLDLFSPELCATLTGQINCRALLEEIERRHLLLIPLDRQRRWFKYHGLFREFLEARLELERPGRSQLILLAAARWFRQAGEPELAIEHALRGRHFAEAADILSAHIADISLRRGQYGRIKRWIAGLPRDILDVHPALKLGLAWTLIFRHKNDEVEALLAGVEAAVPDAVGRGGMTAAEAGEALAACHMGRAIRLGAADRHAEAWREYRAFERKWPDCRPVQRLTVLTASAYSALAMGRIREARRLIAEVAGFFTGHETSHAYGWICIVRARLAMLDGRIDDVVEEARRVIEDEHLGGRPGEMVRDLLAVCAAEAHYESGRLDEARRAMEVASETVMRHVTVELAEPATRVMARLAVAAGDGDGAVAMLRRSIAIAERLQLPRLVELVGCELVTVLLRLGRTEEAWRVEAQMDLSGPTPVEFAASLEARQMVRARLMLSRGDGTRAAGVAAALWNRLRAAGNIRQQISALCIQAAAQASLGDIEQSGRLAARARMTAEQSGLSRAMADEDYLLHDLGTPSASRREEGAIGDARMGICGTLLSHREGHVLSLMAQGMTNRDIGSALVISEETVKWHMRNITRKLNARNRTHAVQIARQTGLLQ